MKTRNRPFLSLLIRLGSITFAVLAGLLGARADIGSIRIDKPLDRRGWNQKWLIPEGAFYLSTPLATKLFVQIRKERTGEFWDPFGAFHMNVPPWDESINMPVKDYGITWGGTWNYAYLIDDYIGGYPPMRSNLEPGAYTVFAWIEYGIGGKAEADPVTFTVDYIEPTVSFTSPANKDAFNYFPMVYQGNSYDPPYKGASGNISGSGIFLVEFRLMRVSDGKYFQWNQTSEALWSDHTNETRAQRSETFWTIKDEFPASFASNMGVFQIEARAGDSALNWSPWKVARFKVEKTPPDCLILSPTNGVPVSELNLVSGEIEDDPDGGGLGRVTLALQRQADGLWWDGSTWGPTEYENGVSLTYYWGGVQPRRVTWNKKLDLPAGFNLPNGNYLLSIRAYDRAENMTNVLQVVTVNKIIPSLTIDSPTNGAVLKWSWPSFTGSAIPAPGRQIVSMNMLLTRKFRDSSISPLRYAAWNGFNWVESSNPVISWLNLSWGPAIWGCYGPFPMGSDLRSGEYSILLTAVDNNGAQGEARSQFWVDIDPPATFYIDEPGDTAVLRALPGIGGQTEDGVNGSGIDRVLMQLYRLDPIPGGGTTAVGWNGSVWTPQGYNLQTRVEDYRWECMDNLPQGQDLPNGSYMVLAAALDRAGNMSSQESIGFEVMKTPPDLTIDAPADRYMTHFSEIRGTMTPGTNRFPIVSTELILWRQSDLAFWDGAAWVGSKAMLSVLRSSMDSNWVCGSALPSGSNLRDDTYVVGIIVADAVGNMATAEQQFTVDTTPPDAPIAFLPSEYDTGASRSDGITSYSRPFIQGFSEPYARIDVKLDGVSLPSFLAEINGSWTFTPATPLADGPHQITARATDLTGNTSPWSNPLSIVIDTTPPRIAANGVYSPGKVSEASSFYFAVTMENTEQGRPCQAVVYWNDNTSDTATIEGGALQFIFTHQYPDDRFMPYSVTCQIEDAAGNNISFSTNITVVNEAPVLRNLAPAQVTAGQQFMFSGDLSEGTSDTITMSISWGDGSPVQTRALPSPGPQYFASPHIYAGTGDFTVIILATDKDLATSLTQWPIHVIPGGTPLISKQPQSQTVMVGSNATFSVAASGFGALRYQWKKDDAMIDGATRSSLDLTNILISASGTYTVVVSDNTNSITSQPATLKVMSLEAIRLSIERAVTWPTDIPPGFRLEGAADPEGPYEAIQTEPATQGGRRLILIDGSGSRRFFRLRN